MTPIPRTPSDLTLERYRLGELPSAEIARIAELAGRDPDLRVRLSDLEASDAAIRDRYGADLAARAVAARVVGERSARRVRLSAPAWVAMASAAVVIVSAAAWLPGAGWRPWASPAETAAPAPGAEAGDRIKGEAAALLLYRKSGTGSERLSDGAAARHGDLVRVAYRASSASFGVIVSVDGRGVVTRHLPVSGEAATALQPGEPMPLADAYELDDAPRWERFFLITSDRPFDVEPVIAAARRAAEAAVAPGADPPAALALPADFDQTSFLLRKIS